MTDVSVYRLCALRAGYLLLAAGLAATVWPLLIDHSPQWPLMNGVVCSMLAAVSILAAFGIRYPLQMLPRDTRLLLLPLPRRCRIAHQFRRTLAV